MPKSFVRVKQIKSKLMSFDTTVNANSRNSVGDCRWLILFLHSATIAVDRAMVFEILKSQGLTLQKILHPKYQILNLGGGVKEFSTPW